MTSQVCLISRPLDKVIIKLHPSVKICKMAYPLLLGEPFLWNQNSNKELLWKWVSHLSLEHIHCFQILDLRQVSDWPAPNHLTPSKGSINSQWAPLRGYEIDPLSAWPIVLSSSGGKSWRNKPAVPLHVKLAYGTAYGVTTGWLASHSWEDARKRFAEETHLSPKRQLPNAQLSPSRLVLAKTTVLTEKNTAKKLTLGGLGEHRARYLHLFEVSFKFWKSLLKIHSAVTRNVFSVSLRIVSRQEMH